MAFILLFAGFETTVNLIGNGVYALLRNPEQRERLQRSLDAGETGLLETGIEELLRYDGPVELATWRFATEPLTLGGQRIAAGDPVLVVLAAADRDPERFADPDTLDLSRRDNQHLGYGHGIHYCLGAPLARLEGQTALATLADAPPGPATRGGSCRFALAWRAHHARTAHSSGGVRIPDIAPVKVTLCQLRDFHVICAASTCDKRSTAATFTVRLTSHLSVTRKATACAPGTADTVAPVRHPPSSSPQESPARPSPSRCSARPVRTRPTPRPGTGSPSARAAACGVPTSATASTAGSSSRRRPGRTYGGDGVRLACRPGQPLAADSRRREGPRRPGATGVAQLRGDLRAHGGRGRCRVSTREACSSPDPTESADPSDEASDEASAEGAIEVVVRQVVGRSRPARRRARRPVRHRASRQPMSRIQSGSADSSRLLRFVRQPRRAVSTVARRPPRRARARRTGGDRDSGRHASRGNGDGRDTRDSAADGTYTVRPGDNLWAIADAQKVHGGWPALYEANKTAVGDDPDLILPGQSLDLGVKAE